jgi:hypothetical protein
MAHYNFNKDIIEGEQGESFVTEWLCSQTNGKRLSNNKTNSHDVIIEFPERQNSIWSGIVSLEIKTDVLVSPSRDTGNMFIEYECRGKPSGISVTQADLFITYFKHLQEVWVIQTANLKELLTTYNFRSVTNAGDENSRTCGYLIPRMKYRQYFKRYNVGVYYGNV